ncbi:hypothetical protein Esti_005336 [Eimeria stiedai]
MLLVSAAAAGRPSSFFPLHTFEAAETEPCLQTVSKQQQRRQEAQERGQQQQRTSTSSSRPAAAAVSSRGAMDTAAPASVPSGWLAVGPEGGLSPISVSAKDGRGYTVRLMQASDYPGVCELLPLVSRGQQQLGEETLAAVLQQPTYLPFCCFSSRAHHGNADDKQQLCGFCELYIQPHLRRAADGRLERVVVAPAFRGCGVATAMCQAVLQLAKTRLGLGKVNLTVEKPDAKHIYTKLGFTRVDTETLTLQL